MTKTHKVYNGLYSRDDILPALVDLMGLDLTKEQEDTILSLPGRSV